MSMRDFQNWRENMERNGASSMVIWPDNNWCCPWVLKQISISQWDYGHKSSKTFVLSCLLSLYFTQDCWFFDSIPAVNASFRAINRAWTKNARNLFLCLTLFKYIVRAFSPWIKPLLHSLTHNLQLRRKERHAIWQKWHFHGKKVEPFVCQIRSR